MNQALKAFFIRARNWEYWPSALVYLPVLPYLFYLMCKSRSFFFFNTANPGIENGGFVLESKWKIYCDAPPDFFPFTKIVYPEETMDAVLQRSEMFFSFPLVAKPDIGGKGKAVAILPDKEALKKYHDSSYTPYLLQQKIPYSNELGIFYARFPDQQNGRITGIVQKEFVKVKGNGQSTLRQLLVNEPRYFLQLAAFEKLIPASELNEILAEGETKLVLEVGNHARGCLFTDVSDKITPRLEHVIDVFCKRYPGFYFGRLDIRFNTWEELEEGKNFGLIEINGAGSEPTHIYDPRHSILKAWAEIIRHWQLLQTISAENKRRGIPYLSIRDGILLLNTHRKTEKTIKKYSL